jgi:hypothetical protein
MEGKNGRGMPVERMNRLIEQPGVVLFFALTFWLVCVFLIRSILSDLLGMHKSKTALKKIRKQYSFRQRLVLEHVKVHTEHAAGFAQLLIKVHHLSVLTMAGCLLLWLFLPNTWRAYILTGRFFLLDAPVMVLDFALDENPFRKHKHRRRFLKYHNTADKSSLF